MKKNYSRTVFQLAISNIKLVGVAIFLLVASQNTNAQTTVFFQDFNGTSISNIANAAITDADYYTETGEVNKFTLLQSGNHGSSYLNINQATAGEFVATDAGSGWVWCLNRNADLATVAPKAVRVSFRAKFDVNSTGSTNTRFTFQIGSGFSNTFSTTNLAMKEADANVYAGFGLKAQSSSNGATLYQLNNTTQMGSTNIGEAYNIWTIIYNNTGASLSYTDPNAATATVANDTYDLWIGTTQWGDDIAVTTPTQSMNNFKFGSFTNGSSGRINIGLDWFKVEDLAAAVPVTFGSIQGLPNANGVNVNWNVLAESNMQSYNIEKSINGTNFNVIGNVIAQHRNNVTYSFVDKNLANGVVYYRIKALENDGSIKYSSVVKVSTQKGKGDISIYPNPIKGKIVNIQLSDLKKGTYSIEITSIIGQKILVKTIDYDGGFKSLQLVLPNFVQKGQYAFTIQCNQTQITKTLIVE